MLGINKARFFLSVLVLLLSLSLTWALLRPYSWAHSKSAVSLALCGFFLSLVDCPPSQLWVCLCPLQSCSYPGVGEFSPAGVCYFRHICGCFWSLCGSTCPIDSPKLVGIQGPLILSLPLVGFVCSLVAGSMFPTTKLFLAIVGPWSWKVHDVLLVCTFLFGVFVIDFCVGLLWKWGGYSFVGLKLFMGLVWVPMSCL